VFKLPLEPLRTTVLLSTSQPPYNINEHINIQLHRYINSYQSFFVLYIWSSSNYSANHFFLCLFSRSALHQLVLSFCSSSTCSVILLCVSSHTAHMLNLILRILSFSFSYSFILFSYRMTNHTQSVSSSFIHTYTTVQLPNSLGKKTTTV
jgi:hypothetical protein